VLDVKEDCILKKEKKRKIVTLFIAAPSELDLFKLLKKRTESMPTIQKRIALAKKEMKVSKMYDSIIINNDLGRSLKELEEALLKSRN
jgi:guanylate kinase